MAKELLSYALFGTVWSSAGAARVRLKEQTDLTPPLHVGGVQRPLSESAGFPLLQVLFPTQLRILTQHFASNAPAVEERHFGAEAYACRGLRCLPGYLFAP